MTSSASIRRAMDAALGLGSVAVALHLRVAPPETVLSRLEASLLLGFWAVAALRVGRATARTGSLPRALAHAHLFVLASVLVTSAAGMLGAPALAVVHAAAFVAAGRFAPPREERTVADLAAAVRRAPAPAVVVAIAAAVAAANAAWGFLAPEGRIDDLTYHLTFPAAWLQDGSLTTMEVPFGNHSPAYHPKNTEAVFAWAIAPFRELFPIAWLQLAWLALTVMTLHDVFRRTGAPPRAAAAAASLFVLGPVVADQALCGYVDVAFGLFLALSLRAVLDLRARPGLRAWLELCAFSGVFAGTKMLGLPLTAVVIAPAFAALALPRVLRAHTAPRLLAGAAAGVLLFLAFGGWWYVRNALLTGNPVFPLMVEAGGRVLLDGAYVNEALPGSSVVSLLDLLPVPLRWLLAGGAAVTVVAAVARAIRPGSGKDGTDPRAAAAVGVLLPAVLAWLFARTIPLDEERFLVITAGFAAGALLVPLSLPRLGAAVEWIVAGTAALCLALPESRLQVLMPVDARKLLVADPEVWRAFALAAAVLAGAGALAALRLRPRVAAVAGALWMAAALASAQQAAVLSDPEGEHAHRHVKELWDGSREIRGLGPGLRVAATGQPATLPFYGAGLGNRVRYVNVNDTPGDLFHDHVLRWPELRAELREDRRGVGYYRRNASEEAWLGNLEAYGADVLVVSPLPNHAREGAYVRDAQGFPRERAWADALPGRFRPVVATRSLRIYDLR